MLDNKDMSTDVWRHVMWTCEYEREKVVRET